MKIPAAQYLRMSTEHQQYSLDNQAAAIGDYASAHGFEVTQTYSDEARSGLTIAERPGLRAMIEDITVGRAEFAAVLVLDVSRWGRFQDADEAAHYEFLCKLGGIKVHYCAESFSNIDGLAANIMKALKRSMAAEYSRELSTKVFAGQCRLVQNGFKVGGAAGYANAQLTSPCWLSISLSASARKPARNSEPSTRRVLNCCRSTTGLGTFESYKMLLSVLSSFARAKPVRWTRPGFGANSRLSVTGRAS